MALPKGSSHRTREEWLALIDGNNDPASRKIVTGVLKAMGHEPISYMRWTVAERIDCIMQRQDLEPVEGDEGFGGEETEVAETKAPAKGKGKGKAKVAAKAASKGAQSMGASAEAGAKVLELLQNVVGRLEAVESQNEQLLAYISNVQDLGESNLALTSDQHFLTRVLVQSNKQLAMNTEDTDLQQALYQQLVVVIEDAATGNAG